MASRDAFEMKRGDSYPLDVTITDKATGAPANLTGCTVEMTVDQRENPDDTSTRVFTRTAVIAAPLTGVAVITPTALDTAVAGEFWYDVQVTDGSGHIRTPIKAPFTITQDITK